MYIYNIYIYIFVEKMHQKKANVKYIKYTKYGLFLLSHDYLVVQATMMGNECFMITIYIQLYIITR